ncbi:MAG: glycosyltransferase family 9 protein [Fusobacteriaceae bacterium]
MKYKVKGFFRDLKKKKSKIFKTSHLKTLLAQEITESYMAIYKKFKKYNPQNRVLIISPDALGDTVVKSATVRIIAEHYGKEKIYIATSEKWQDIWKSLGYRVIPITVGSGLLSKISGKIRYYNEVNKLDFKKIIMIKHAHTDGKKDKNYLCQEQVEIEKTGEDSGKYILADHQKLLRMLFQKEYTLDELKPDISSIFQEGKSEETITVGVGAAGEIKTLPLEKMIQIIDFLGEKFPEKKVLLLGSGNKQRKYAQEIIGRSSNRNIVNLVDGVSLLKSLELIKNSYFFLGYDSGLSNCALALDKKTVVLFWTEESRWKHPYKNIKLVMGDGESPVNDGYYGTPMLNSIKISQIETALKELGIE